MGNPQFLTDTLTNLGKFSRDFFGEMVRIHRSTVLRLVLKKDKFRYKLTMPVLVGRVVHARLEA